jgi:twinkle protein
MSFIDYDTLIPEVVALYDDGLKPGDPTGWKMLDVHYTVAMNQWTLVTGTPHAGKSEWLDALMVNLADKYGWRFMIFSPENHPLALHAAKILEKYIGKPFGAGPTARMTPDERDEGLVWMKGRFNFLKLEEPSLESIIENCEKWVSGARKTGIVVDPWNTLEHRRPKDMTGTEYISQQLSWIINFTRNNYVHFWLVAHPKKPAPDRMGKPPTPYEISDSAHFYNKADNIITVHRDQSAESQTVEIHVQKCRFKHIGRIGKVDLIYDKVTGRYHQQFGIANYYERP